MENKLKNAILIPGWMGGVLKYEKYDGPDIWIGKDFPKEKTEASWIITHSLGAHFALDYWQQDTNKKFILVNPLLSQKKSTEKIVAWFKFFCTERPDFSKKISSLNLPLAIRKFFLMSKIDLENIFTNISPERIIVIRGKNDQFLCNTACVNLIKRYGIRLIEVENTGHNWNKKIDEIIEKIVST